jgi:uncharacterized Tic20 family protein
MAGEYQSPTSDPVAAGMALSPPTPEERNWALLAHLSGLITAWFAGFSFLGPLIIWLIKKDQSTFVADQAKEALNFQIAVSIAVWVSVPLIWFFCIGLITLAIAYVGSIVYSIIAAMEANKGAYYRYPYTLRLIS